MINAISRFFLFAGVTFLLFGAYMLYLRHSPQILTFEKAPTTVHTLSYESPKNIEIPSINVNLPIVPAIMKGNVWETTHNGISYLSSSPIPGEKGNSVLYGHNWSSLLAHLPQVKPGQKIVITMQNGSKKSFVVEYTAVVNPSDAYIIDNTTDTRITLYTCTGFLDSKRFVVVAKPQA